MKTFSPEELKKFGEMVSSPFFNRKTPVLKLFIHLKKYYPEFKDPELKKEVVYSQVFPDKRYNYGTMKNLIYELQELAERFLSDTEMRNNSFEIKRSLINSLRKRSLVSLSKKKLRELQNANSEIQINDYDYFLKLHYINRMNQDLLLESSKGIVDISKKINEEYIMYLFSSIKYLKKYYLHDALREYNIIITNKNIIDTASVLSESKSLINNYDNEFTELPLQLEVSFLKMNLGSIPEEDFLKIKKLVLTDLYEMNVDKEITYGFSIYLLNYCRIKNLTERRYKSYAFEILKSLADNNNFESGSAHLNIVLMRNIILISTELGEFRWCENFLDNYLIKTHPNFRDNLMNFYLAHKYFYQRNFEKSLEYLSMFRSDDIYDKNYIKELQVINYYELEYFDLLNEQLESFKKFLTKNNKLPQTYREQYLKFVNYMYKLFRAASGKKTDVRYLREKLFLETELIFKDWFINKTEELEKD
ncbi:MAG: hypothetical protein JSS91_13480 [Bacteroidetes bacterium]|nr:hypothetical protein [Bacteroidota bacterium]